MNTPRRMARTASVNGGLPKAKIGVTALTVRWLWKSGIPVSSDSRVATVSFPLAGGP